MTRTRDTRYAEVTSSAPIDELSFGEHHVLLERFQQVFPEAATDKPDGVEHHSLGLPTKPSRQQRLAARLEHLHGVCQRYVAAPLDGETIHGTFAFRLSDDGRRWLPVKLRAYDSRYAAELMRLVDPTNGQFPFRRCPECQRVFVPRRENQKYCTPTCTASANERLRRDHKKEQNKQYMRRRRAAGGQDQGR